MKKRVFNEKGVALIGTVGLLLVLVTTGLAFLKMSSHESDSAHQRHEQLKAFWKAEEALSRGRAQMNKLKEPDGYRAVTLDDAKEGYTARIAVRRLKETEFDAYEITGEVYSKDDLVRPVFSLVSVEKPKIGADYFMLYEDPGDCPACPFFDSRDTVDGHLHVNKYVAVTGHPVFKGLVTTGDPFPGYRSLEFRDYDPPQKIENTGEIFPIPTAAEDVREKAPHLVLNPEQRAVIFFTGAGYEVRIRDAQNEQVLRYDRSVALPEGKGSGLFVEGDAEVSGILEGKFTLGASGDIIITDNLTYADADRSTGKPAPGSTNVLGLISEGNVFVKQKQVPPFVGRGITIDASILAMDSTFSVVNYREYAQSMGVMRLWGNVVQYQRGIIGNVRLRGTVEMGYYKSWHYDQRLQTVQPPYMPPLKDEKGNMRFKTIYWKRPDV